MNRRLEWSLKILKLWALNTLRKKQYRKFETNIPRKGTARPISTFMCLWAIYKFPRSICPFYCRKICGPILGMYRSQTHECGNWDSGRAIPTKGIHVWDFRWSVCKHACKDDIYLQLENMMMTYAPSAYIVVIAVDEKASLDQAERILAYLK